MTPGPDWADIRIPAHRSARVVLVVSALGEDGIVTAQSADEYDPDDPVEILSILPSQFHEQFLAEYDTAVTGARRPEHYRQLHRLLRLWRLRAAAYSDPGYEARLQAVQDAVRTGRRKGTPIEEVVPDWAERIAAAQRPGADG